MTHFSGTKAEPDDNGTLRLCRRRPARKVQGDAPYSVILGGRVLARLPNAASVAWFILSGRLWGAAVSYRGEEVLPRVSLGVGKRRTRGAYRSAVARLRETLPTRIQTSADAVDARVDAYRARIERKYAA